MYELKLLRVEIETADIKVFWFVAQDHQHRNLFGWILTEMGSRPR
jgi:hypothetical protein